MTDWLMVVITGIYVIATIFICKANFKSAKETRAQTVELQRQFEEMNRAFVTVTIEMIRNGLLVLQFNNLGKRIAHNVRVNVPLSFIQNLPEDGIKQEFDTLQDSVFTLGIGQKLYIAMGSNLQLKHIGQQLLEISISYEDATGEYHEVNTIDLTQYYWALLYESPVEDASRELKSMANSIKGLNDTGKKILQQLNNNQETKV